MNIATPITMLVGKGNGPALLVAGILLAAWLIKNSQAQQAQQASTPPKR